MKEQSGRIEVNADEFRAAAAQLLNGGKVAPPQPSERERLALEREKIKLERERLALERERARITRENAPKTDKPRRDRSRLVYGAFVAACAVAWLVWEIVLLIKFT